MNKFKLVMLAAFISISSVALAQKTGYISVDQMISIMPEVAKIDTQLQKYQADSIASYIIAALDWVLANKDLHNIRVVNMSLGAGVFESYHTDPLTQAAKRVVDAGIVVVASAGNFGKAKDGTPQYGAIGAPGNAPWVLTVGASSTMGTTDRRDDTMAAYSSAIPGTSCFGR